MNPKPVPSAVPRSPPKAKLAAAKKPPAPAGGKREKPLCQTCGHWSPAMEYGVDEKSGYCDHWEKLTARDFSCEEYVSREKFKALQSQLAEENEEYLDEET